jgi:hypothetical protein
MSDDRRLLELALKGLEVEQQRVEEEIVKIKLRLGKESGVRTHGNRQLGKRNGGISPAGRKRLSALMKARWASGNPPIKFKKKKAA